MNLHPDSDAVGPIDEPTRQRTTAWIWLGVYALLAAGVLSVLLALARTPGFQDFLPWKDFFRTALVVHVDLSVLVWFMACAGMVWTLFSSRQSRWNVLAIALAVLGTVMISLAPFVGDGKPLMNNYVPVLQHNWFYIALASLAAGLVVQALCFLRQTRITFSEPGYLNTIRFALALAAVSILFAVVCVGWSWALIPAGIEGKVFFEYLFWGGGHVQQFTNTVLALVAWVLLVAGSGGRFPMGPRTGMALFALVVAPLAIVPWIYRLPVESGASIREFTELMRWGGLAAAPLCLIVLSGLFNHTPPNTDQRPLRAALLCSLSLFAAGGLLGFMIKGSNTMIPAHYHGSIVGVTLAFMGVVYYILPRLGYAITHRRMLNWQPYVFATGQMLHITGLAMSGGYGVQRKVAGAEQALDGAAQTLGMGMMGLGGLLAAIGGLLFLIVTIAALRGDRRVREPLAAGA
ncbi:MAG: cbb3-type cytochrome c oxidase subunit I [Pseudomonadales bacterium]|nr:cbb3-type cytochrome c oxidase subunit I [Pseudomonadales bacterium]MDP6472821.1 cbb3-type cytochrome c oxidase subunit I [Pseudomonadales bacterium]MDP6828037.1 cbb3-type cytochrome c oxidase subunit I [Pseudomonadales bacterium]MDP6971730.1 cbb3-type cytochrome c oxidase subunit I [Pseudomonadales bacterium]